MRGAVPIVVNALILNVNDMYKIGVSSIANFEDDVNSFIKDNPNYRVVTITAVDITTIIVLLKEEK